MPTPKPRIFVSSVMVGFEEEREAARKGIIAAGGEPILINDTPSQGISSRSACLDAVASCDALVVIVGERGGWPAPSGKVVVEEEVDEARSRNLPIRVFGQKGIERDKEGQKLYATLSDYISGFFRKEYEDCSELEALVLDACSDIQPLPTDTEKMTSKDSVRAIVNQVAEKYSQHQDAASVTLRVVIAAERGGRVLEPSKIEDENFHHELISFAQAPRVGLVSYEQGFSPSIEGDDLILQGRQEDDYQTPRTACVRITEEGVISVDYPLEIRRERRGGQISLDTNSAFTEDKFRRGIKSSLLLAHHVYEQVDPYYRHERFLVDVGLVGAAGKDLVASTIQLERPQVSRMYMGNFHNQTLEVLFPMSQVNVSSRDGLKASEAFVNEIILYTKRRLAEAKN